MKRNIGIMMFIFAACFASFGLYHGVSSVQAQSRYDLDFSVDWDEPCEDMTKSVVLPDERTILLYMETQGAEPITVSVLDSEGGVVYSDEGVAVRKQTQIEAPAGTYEVKVEFHGQPSAKAKIKAACVPR